MLKSAHIMIAGLVLASAGAAEGVAQTVNPFAPLPAIGHPNISPDGRWLSSECRAGDGAAICINDLATGEISQIIPMPERAWMVDSYFVSDDHLYISIGFIDTLTLNSGLEDVTFVRSMAIRPSTGASTRLLTSQTWTTNNTNIVSIDRDDPDSVLIGLLSLDRSEVGTGSRMRSRERFRNELYRVNLNTGEGRIVDRSEAFDRVLDADGEDVATVLYDPESYRFEIRRGDIRGELIYSGTYQNDYPSVIGLMGADSLLTYFPGGENRGYRELAMSTGEILPIPVEGLDLITGAIFDHDARLVGFWGENDGMVRQYFTDTAFRQDVSALSNALGAQILIESFSADRDRLVVSTTAPSVPDSYYLYERSAGALSPIDDAYPHLFGVALPQRQSFVYQASDGLEIEAILTLPEGWSPEAGALPMVVLPHGGPAARDTLSFDWWAQAYAAEGYAVLQPNFRGSVGYGLSFREAGYGEFGGRMVQDLLDGAEALKAAGVARQAPYCVAGGSYGGYAALMAGIMAPLDVACVVAFAPVTHPSGMLREERNMGSFISYNFWEQYMGDILYDADAANAISVVRRADELTMPTLVLHGAEDGVVPIEESLALSRAIGRGSDHFTFVTLEGESHFLVRQSSRQILLDRSIELMNQTIGR